MTLVISLLRVKSCVCVCVCVCHSVVSDSLRPHKLHPAWLLCPCGSPGKNTGVACHSLKPWGDCMCHSKCKRKAIQVQAIFTVAYKPLLDLALRHLSDFISAPLPSLTLPLTHPNHTASVKSPGQHRHATALRHLPQLFPRSTWLTSSSLSCPYLNFIFNKDYLDSLLKNHNPS